MFKEQSKKWKPITLKYMTQVISAIHHFIKNILVLICPDERVREELWNSYLLEELQKSYRRALDHVRLLLEIEREEVPLTLNHYFNDNLQKSQSDRLVTLMEKLGLQKATPVTNTVGHVVGYKEELIFDKDVLRNISFNMANSEHVRQLIHDILKSYYKVTRKNFVDVIYKQAVSHYLLKGKGGPLTIFSTQMVLDLNEDQLDMIAAEDGPVKLHREKLGRDIQNFENALKVLRGSA